MPPPPPRTLRQANAATARLAGARASAACISACSSAFLPLASQTDRHFDNLFSPRTQIKTTIATKKEAPGKQAAFSPPWGSGLSLISEISRVPSLQGQLDL